MKLKNFKITNKGLYWGLILTFIMLYACVGFVSTLHSITFFNLANNMGLAVLLGITYEIGQASVLFSILMTKNKDKFLPWALMILLTALQVTANVYASFKFMSQSGTNDWQYWQKSILFGVQASSPEMYQVIISWISGALLPVVALGMTALVAENIKLMTEGDKPPALPPRDVVPADEVEEIIANEVENKVAALTKQKENTNEETLEALYEEMNNKLIPDKEKGQFEKDFIIPEDDEKKKRGRPPKKEQESLPTEDVKIPKKRTRISDPLKKKTKIKRVKNLEELEKPSRGDEVIALIENMAKESKKDTITPTSVGEDVSSEKPLDTPEVLKPYVESGVEVIDAKAIEKENVKKNQ